jgi:membrane protein YdbS with pleckstrin-like domain
MRLMTAHKITIGAASVLALILAVRAALLYSSNHDRSELAHVAIAIVILLALGAYLRSIWRR